MPTHLRWAGKAIRFDSGTAFERNRARNLFQPDRLVTLRTAPLAGLPGDLEARGLWRLSLMAFSRKWL